MYRFFCEKVGSEADELIQATFMACAKARDQFRKDSSFRTYLYAVARRELYQHFRRRTRNAKMDFAVTSMADLGTSPSSHLARGERKALLAQALRQLPLQQQIIIELHYWEDMRAPQLAAIFEIAEPTARVWLHRARQALRERMAGLTAAPGGDPRGDPALEDWAREIRLQRRATHDREDT